MNKIKIARRVLFALLIMFSFLLLNQYYQYKKSDIIYEEAREKYHLSVKNLKQALDIENLDETEKIKTNNHKKTISETKQKESNLVIGENVIGWIKIEETNIDYPVVQSIDNNFYLDHNYLGEKDIKGSIYMDYRNDILGQDENHIIYGHKMADGTMFSDLTLYVEEATYKEYFNNHNIIKYDNPEETIEWKIFSAYVVDLDKEDYHIFTNYKSDEEFKLFIDDANRRSIVKSDIEVKLEDEIMTLVTCSFWYDNARVIIHAVRQ